jgi:hypothetical protein
LLQSRTADSQSFGQTFDGRPRPRQPDENQDPHELRAGKTAFPFDEAGTPRHFVADVSEDRLQCLGDPFHNISHEELLFVSRCRPKQMLPKEFLFNLEHMGATPLEIDP